jgi:hypothetical protein
MGNIFEIRNADGSVSVPVQQLTDFDGNRAWANVAPLANGGFFVTYDDINNPNGTITHSGGLSGQVARQSDVTWRTFNAAGVGGVPTIAYTGVEAINHASTDRTSGEQSSADPVQLAGGQVAFAYRDQRFVGLTTKKATIRTTTSSTP